MEGTEYDRLGASTCEITCSGDASSTCGGYDAFEAFTLPAYDYVAPVKPDGYIGCFVDSRSDRVFASPQTVSSDNSAAVRVCLCV